MDHVTRGKKRKCEKRRCEKKRATSSNTRPSSPYVLEQENTLVREHISKRTHSKRTLPYVLEQENTIGKRTH
jgi:hypothetical protein